MFGIVLYCISSKNRCASLVRACAGLFVRSFVRRPCAGALVRCPCAVLARKVVRGAEIGQDRADLASQQFHKNMYIYAVA